MQRIFIKGIMENFKKCSKCGRELPASEFWKNASTEDGLQTYCKECGNVDVYKRQILRKTILHTQKKSSNGFM